MRNPLDRKKYKRAVIILAGGDGTHLHQSTKFITRCCVPKQFCRFAGHETLFEQTLHTAAGLAPRRATAIVVNRAHREFYDQLAGVFRSSIVAQPSNRGTVPAILCGLRRLAKLGRNTIVAVFPCDHRFRNDDRFIYHIEQAMAAVEVFPSLSVVLGIVPTAPESSFGWIEPGDSIYPVGSPLFRVRRFREEARAEMAAKLMLEGCLWNSLVVIATAPRLLEMIGECVPALYVAFNAAFASFDSGGGYSAIEELYRNMHTCGFSQEVLARCPPGLAVKRVEDVEHNDIDKVDPPRTLGYLQSQAESFGGSSLNP
jgi:mannose-1-phosphate guanylyltransferase / mannose-6-phosphate isomerase